MDWLANWPLHDGREANMFEEERNLQNCCLKIAKSNLRQKKRTTKTTRSSEIERITKEQRVTINILTVTIA